MIRHCVQRGYIAYYSVGFVNGHWDPNVGGWRKEAKVRLLAHFLIISHYFLIILNCNGISQEGTKGRLNVLNVLGFKRDLSKALSS